MKHCMCMATVTSCSEIDCIFVLMLSKTVFSDDQDGMTALMWASCEGHINVVKVLFSFCKAQVDLQNKVRHNIS